MSSPDIKWFVDARYGLFIHYGLYSLLGRGEWVMNRERISVEEYRELTEHFNAACFDAEAICDLAVCAGMRYVVLTTMHHEGFHLYPTAWSPFHSKRDLVAELIDSARKRNLRVGLYHSLNNWTSTPDAVDALEDSAAYEKFIVGVFDRIRELVTRYNPVDLLWYDGWWPFNAEGWRALRMNEMVRTIQPQILFNGRNGLPGDFATPEGHMGAPSPWRPWEACMTMNNSWGYHAGDHDWKTPGQVVDLLAAAAQGQGNLLLNIGLRGDGAIPEASVRVLEDVGAWMRRGGREALFGTDRFTFDLRERGEHKGDWNHTGPCTVKGNTMYWLMRRWPGSSAALGGLEMKVKHISLLNGGGAVTFRQKRNRLMLSGLPDTPPDPLCPVLRLECDRPPVIYQSAGLRVPSVPHPHYDPCPSDIQH